MKALSQSLNRFPRPHKGKGFTLVELLVVLTIISLLAVLANTGFQSILSTSYDSETSDISSTLIRARAYAMANNTYVFVGIEEVDASKPSSGIQTPGTGRIGVTVVATNDGSRGYNPAAPTSIPDANFAPTANTQLTVISPLHHYDNLHLLTAAGSGMSSLPNSNSGMSWNAANSASLTTFNWPVNSTGANAQYAFGTNGTIIQFNPQGEAQVITGPNTDSILQWIEIDLAPTHESNFSGTAKNPVTILIDGASGSVSAYRA